MFSVRAYKACLHGQLSSNVRPRIHFTMQAQALRMRRSPLCMAPHLGTSLQAKPVAISSVAFGKRPKPTTADDWSPSERADPLVEAGSRPLTPQAPGQNVSHSGARTPGKAQSALPSSQSGAAAAEYGSRHNRMCASARSTAGLGFRAACSAEREAPVESLVVQHMRVYPRRGLTPRSS